MAPLHRHLIAAVAWAWIGVIAYATLSRVTVVYEVYTTLAPVIAHPSIVHYVHVSHVVAYAIAGALFVLAYPKRPILVCCLMIGAALSLEYLQNFTPDRHGTMIDAAEKVVGGLTGAVLALAARAAVARLE